MSRARATRAGVWSALDVVFRQGVTLAVTVVLARLLTPEDFGVIALLTFFTGLSLVFVEGGLAAALIQRQQTDLVQESSVFWWNMAAGLLFGVFLIALGPALARFFDQPVLADLMWVAAAQVLLGAAGAVQGALLMRDLRFDTITKIGAAASLTSGAVGIVLALRGMGVWALAAQILTLSAINSLGLWLAGPWRPGFRFRFDAVRDLLKFGGWLSLSTALEVLYTQGFAMLLGKLYGFRSLGFYTRAASLQAVPVVLLSTIVTRVAFPLFSEKKDQPDALQRGARTALQVVMLIAVPMMVGISLTADLIVRVLLGPGWEPSSPILAILALGGVLIPMHAMNLQILLATGQSATYFRVEVVKKVIGVAFMICGSLLGIKGIAWAYVAYSCIALFINVAPVRRTLGYGIGRQMRDVADIFLAAGVMAAVVLGVKPLLETSPIVSLLALAATGAGAYVLAGLAMRSASFRQGLDIILHLARLTPAGGSQAS